MPEIHAGRYTAQLDAPVVVLLIGMRVNRWWKVRTWWQVAAAMPKMIRALVEDPDLGLLNLEQFSRGRTSMMVMYWQSEEHLHRFATDRTLPHAPAWARFMRETAGSGDVGIYHETYLVEPGHSEAIYAGMPIFGLAKATRHVPVTAGSQTARQRLSRQAATVS